MCGVFDRWIGVIDQKTLDIAGMVLGLGLVYYSIRGCQCTRQITRASFPFTATARRLWRVCQIPGPSTDVEVLRRGNIAHRLLVPQHVSQLTVVPTSMSATLVAPLHASVTS